MRQMLSDIHLQKLHCYTQPSSNSHKPTIRSQTRSGQKIRDKRLAKATLR